MITLAVVAFNDTPADGTLQVQFDELGGSIGRAGSNQLVLPDPERMVSRVAAQVVFRNGAFAIVDRGSNPISLNGRVLPSGREAPLAHGDRLNICGYEIGVKVGVTTAAAPSDPFSGLFGPADESPADKRLPDPLARKPAATAPPAPTRSAPQAGGIPEDWDIFAAPAPAPARPGTAPRQRDALGLDVGAAAPESLVAGLGTPAAAASSLDQLFGLGPAVGGDPLADSPLDAPMAQPNMAGSADPMQALRSAPRGSATAQPDRMSDLQRPYVPPAMKPAAAAVAAPVQRPAPALAPVPIPNPKTPTPTLPPPPMPVPPPMPTASRPTSPARPAASAPPAAARPGAAAETAQLLDALRRGLAMPELDLPTLTPALMERIGEIVRASVQGTLELLQARSAVQQPPRAEAGASPAGPINPLKLSPSLEVALQHLLVPARGFTAAGPAMAEACADLRTHQLAYAAGMRAALNEALQRLDPAQIEGRLGEKSTSGLRNLLGAGKQARLWELFVEEQASVRQDVATDFQAAFGKAFSQAYEEQVQRLQARRGAGRPGR